MNISETGIALIKKFEGFSPKPYYCPAGVLTIGYGHVLRGKPTISEISEEQAHDYLMEDLISVEAAVNRLVDVALSQGQFDALCSLVFNIGIGAFARSTLLRLLNEGKYAEAAGQFGRWNRAGKQILPGLIARREAERAMFVA